MILLLLLFSTSARASDITCPAGAQAATRSTEGGSIEECLSSSTGKPEGPRHEYDASHVLRRSWSFKNGVADGEFKVYDEKSHLLREGTFVQGRLQGQVRRWYPNGNLEDETYWVDGRPHGKAKRYFENGKLKEDGEYRTGRRVGIWKNGQDDGAALPDRDYGSFKRTSASALKATASVLGPDGAKIAWSPDADVEVREYHEGEFGYVARIHAQLPGRGWKLTQGSETYRPWDAEEKRVTLELPIRGAETRYEVAAVGPEGASDAYQVTVSAPEYDSEKKQLDRRPPRSSYFLLAAGLNSLSYSEGSSISFSMASLGVKAMYRNLLLPPYLDVALSAYYNGVPLTKSGLEPAKFLGLNARAGFVVPGLPESWSLSLMGGVYYTTTFVTGDAYGYKNLLGPQLYPYLSRRLGNDDLAFAYFKWSPVSNGLGVLVLSDRELAAGGGWTHALASGGRIGILFDYANLKISSYNVHLSNDTYGASVAYGF